MGKNNNSSDAFFIIFISILSIVVIFGFIITYFGEIIKSKTNILWGIIILFSILILSYFLYLLAQKFKIDSNNNTNIKVRKMSIKNRLILSFILIGVLIMAITTLSSYSIGMKTLKVNIINNLENSANTLENHLEDHIENELQKLKLTSSRTKLRKTLLEYIIYL